MMIPRYQPDLHPAAWLQWLRADPRSAEAARERLVQALDGPETRRRPLPFVSGRQALYAYFRNVSARRYGSVLLSAQACPVVFHAVRSAGLAVRFVDVDRTYPSPSAEQYLAAIGPDTVGIIVAPLYGYVQSEWSALLEQLGDAELFLDLAQGLLLAEKLDPALVQRADALLYSFGLGKGLDTGGALLLARGRLEVTGGGPEPTDHPLRVLFTGTALRALIASGVYSRVLERIEAAAEAMKTFDRRARDLAPESLYVLWHARLTAFEADVGRARQRALVLAGLRSVQDACRDVPAFCRPDATHLRQIVRLRDPTRRPTVVEALRRSRVDCAPAGEPLPGAYASGAVAGCFPNAQAFGQDAIRLPFMGRVTSAGFEGVCRALESALA